MSLSDQLTDYIHAAFSGLWIHTSEPDEAERELVQLARHREWKLAVWDVAAGIRVFSKTKATLVEGTNDPLAALRALPAMAEPNGTSLLVLHNFHRFLSNPEVVQTMFGQLVAGKKQRTFLIVMAPVVQIPIELDKLFVVLDHALPSREQLEGIAQGLTSEQPDDLPSGPALQRVLDAAAGLTRYEAEGAFALSLTRHNALRPESIWELKAQTLKKNNLLTLHQGDERFDNLGGLTNLKDFCRRALQPGKSVKARGILLLGVSGTGKSIFAKSLGNEMGRPTLIQMRRKIEQVRARCRPLWHFKYQLVAALAVAAGLGIAGFFAGPTLAAAASAVCGFVATLAVQAGLWLRRQLIRALPASNPITLFHA